MGSGSGGGMPASRDLGFNALGFGWPTLWQGPHAAAALARRVELKLQIEPFRCWRIEDLKRVPADQVIAVEGRWTDHTFLQTAQRVWRGKAPRHFLQHVVFQSPGNSRRFVEAVARHFPQALPIDAPYLAHSLVEICPSNMPQPKAYVEQPRGVVFDTYHVRQFGLSETGMLDFTAELIATKKIQLVQFQTRDESELLQFLQGQGLLYRLTELLLHTLPVAVPCVIELPPWPFVRYRADSVSAYLIRIKSALLHLHPACGLS
jgi:hypothetical protein